MATVRAGSAVDVIIEGPEGIGKTALVEDFFARQHGARHCRATGLQWEQDLRFGVIEQLLAGHGDADTVSSWPASTRSPIAVSRQLLTAWGEVEEPSPLIVLIDNAQWADVGSLQALSSAMRRMSSEQVLLLLVTRDRDGVTTEIRDVLHHHSGPTLKVGPIKPEDVQTLAIKWAGVDLSAPSARRLCSHTHGNPLHLRQLLHEIPTENWSRWQPMLPAPQTYVTTVASRMASCGEAARALVEAAAVLGDTTSFAEAAQLAGITAPVEALDEAFRASLLSTLDGRQIEFPSPLTRAAVYTDMPPLRREQLHRHAVDIVDNEATRLIHRVAITPFADGGLADELEEFASRQAALGAWSIAGRALVDASRLSPRQTDRELRAVRAVDALVGAGDLPQAIAYAPAIESFPPSALRDAVLGYLAILLGRPAEAESLLARAWQHCDLQSDPDTAALICQRRVLHSMSRWHGPELVAWVHRAVRLVAADHPSAIESEAILGLGLGACGQIEQARDAYQELSAKIEVGAQAQRFKMGKGWLDLATDDPLTAHRELESAVPTQYRMGSARISLWAQAWLARTQFVLGHWDDAIHTVNRAAAQLDHVGLDLVRPLVHWTGAQTHALRGNWDQAYEHLQQGSAGTHNYEIMLIPACMARAHCSEVTADYESVLRALEPLVQLQPRRGIDEPGFWPWHDVYANALVQTNQIEAADAFLRPLEERSAARGHRSAMARLGYVRGRIEGTTGAIEAAIESFERALNHIRELPLPYEWARVNFAYGQTLRRAGKRRDADVVLRNAREAFAGLGAQSYVTRCDRELKASGMNTKRGSVDLTQLTAQEQAVATLVASGKSNKQTAMELFISVKTVQFHLTRVYAKLGINSRGELAARFREEQADGG